MSNDQVVRRLQQHARELALKRENVYRVRAYRRAAESLFRLDAPVETFPPERLERLPGVGRHLATAISHYAKTGEWKTFAELN